MMAALALKLARLAAELPDEPVDLSGELSQLFA